MTLFDPVTGKVTDKEALRSIQFNGKGMRIPQTKVVDGKKVTEIVRDDDGSTGGYTTEHGSGRVDANVYARSAEAKLSNLGD